MVAVGIATRADNTTPVAEGLKLPWKKMREGRSGGDRDRENCGGDRRDSETRTLLC